MFDLRVAATARHISGRDRRDRRATRVWGGTVGDEAAHLRLPHPHDLAARLVRRRHHHPRLAVDATPLATPIDRRP
eukprot:3968820-Prymnesium_polylepis.1